MSSTIYIQFGEQRDYLIGPIHSNEKTNVTGGKVVIKQYAQIGAHCLIFPNITIGEGSVVGAYSIVKKDVRPWGVYFGIPAKFKRERNKGLLTLL